MKQSDKARLRLDEVREYNILHSVDERKYDDIVELAAQICDTPISIITFFTEEHQWFKAKKGLEIRQTDISVSFCAHTVEEEDIFVVQDANCDNRFINNALVTGPPNIRFYAGVQIKSSRGITIGSLAVIDTKPRELTERQSSALKILVSQIEDLLELRKQNLELERRLRDKASQVIDILQRISDAFIAVDFQWSITYINTKAAKIIKQSSGVLTGKNLLHVLPEDLAAAFLPLAKKALETQQEQYEEAYFTANNLWLEGHIYPSPSGLSIYFRDVSERKKLESSLRESEANYRRLIEGNPQPMWIYDLKDMRILEVNNAAVTKYGYSKEEFLNLTIFDLRPKDQVPKLKEHLRRVELGSVKGYTQSGPWKHLTKHGEVIDVEITSHYIQWQGRSASFTLAWDVTRRLKMQASLREAEEKYRGIFENAAEGIYQTTPEGRFVTANPAMAAMLGFSSPEELMNAVANTEDLYADIESREALKRMLQEKGKVKGVEFQLMKKDRSLIWVRANVRLIREDNGDAVKYLEGTLEDITERKEAAEKILFQFEELRKANEELDRFVYSVSHDLRAPLATILGLVHVAELESLPGSPGQYLKMIELNIKRLDGLINDILDYSQNSRTDIQYQQIDFYRLIRDVIKNYQFLPHSDRLKVGIEIEDNEGFVSDPYRLTIIFNNLFSNAVKYQDLKKTESTLFIKITVRADKVTITFVDNGIGIRHEYLDRIFNMFYRASHNSKGSGLGLYIAKESVLKLGGTINVESNYGQSTSFIVEIPNVMTRQ